MPRNKITLDLSFGPMVALASGAPARLTVIPGTLSDELLAWLEGARRRPIDATRINLLLHAFGQAVARTRWNPSIASPDPRVLRFGVPFRECHWSFGLTPRRNA